MCKIYNIYIYIYILTSLSHSVSVQPGWIHASVHLILVIGVSRCQCLLRPSHLIPRPGRDSCVGPASGSRQTASGCLHCSGTVWRCHDPPHRVGCCLVDWRSPKTGQKITSGTSAISFIQNNKCSGVFDNEQYLVDGIIGLWVGTLCWSHDLWSLPSPVQECPVRCTTLSHQVLGVWRECQADKLCGVYFSWTQDLPLAKWMEVINGDGGSFSFLSNGNIAPVGTDSHGCHSLTLVRRWNEPLCFLIYVVQDAVGTRWVYNSLLIMIGYVAHDSRLHAKNMAGLC